ncbi:MAG: hypothetical protein JRH20_30300 [Deltaproteobacteria bacterium]|nr:hypothetical protein [Deltaproteobacteria bacterium]
MQTSDLSAKLYIGLVLALGVMGCGSTPLSIEGAQQAAKPMLSKADAAADQADRQCQLMLRTISREHDDQGYRTQCVDGSCNWVWSGRVELAEALVGATVGVLYRRTNDETWWQVAATPLTDAVAGDNSYEFKIHEHLFGRASDASPIEVVPFIARADGSRLFDHNYHQGDLENHRLDGNNAFAMGHEGICRPVEARHIFIQQGADYLTGQVRQGGYLTISYPMGRMNSCRQPQDAYWGWDTVATVRFSPGGQIVSQSMRTFETPDPAPAGVVGSRVFSTKIPTDALNAELWFRHSSNAGCEAWDSKYGANYRYEVWPAVDDERCIGIDKWTKDHSDMPYHAADYCLTYQVDEHRNAESCEFHVSGIGDAYMGHYGVAQNWVEAYITPGTVPGELLNAGMVVLYYHTNTKVHGERTIIARPFAENTWQTGYQYIRSSYRGGVSKYDVKQMAFFIDVREPTGKVVRFWQSRHGANYSWNDAFGASTTTKYIAYGSIKYAGGDAGIFDARNTCH